MELNKIYNEDNLQTMARMPEGFIDLVVTSPPYDNLRAYKGFTFDYRSVIKELYRVIKPGGVVVWVVGDATVNGSETGTSFRQALYAMECGFNLHDTMIYRKQNYIPLSHNRYEQEFEYMFVFSKGRPSVFDPIKIESLYAGKSENLKRKGYGFKEGGYRRRDEVITYNDYKIKGNIWTYSVGNSGVNHPAVFPESLASDNIRTWSKENDLVYDPFSGSGTTAKMALLLDRNYIGSEISAEYCQIAEKRIAAHKAQLKLF